MVEIENQAVSIGAFPSVKATTYAVWHKFYADRNRKWTRSDAFDIIIASAIPYVDAVVTESHLADGLRKTKRLGDFIEHLTVHTLRDSDTPHQRPHCTTRHGRQDAATPNSRSPQQ
jgi:hypothetical protein